MFFLVCVRGVQIFAWTLVACLRLLNTCDFVEWSRFLHECSFACLRLFNTCNFMWRGVQIFARNWQHGTVLQPEHKKTPLETQEHNMLYSYCVSTLMMACLLSMPASSTPYKASTSVMFSTPCLLLSSFPHLPKCLMLDGKTMQCTACCYDLLGFPWWAHIKNIQTMESPLQVSNPMFHTTATGGMTPVESQLRWSQSSIILKRFQQVTLGWIDAIPKNVVFRFGYNAVNRPTTHGTHKSDVLNTWVSCAFSKCPTSIEEMLKSSKTVSWKQNNNNILVTKLTEGGVHKFCNWHTPEATLCLLFSSHWSSLLERTPPGVNWSLHGCHQYCQSPQEIQIWHESNPLFLSACVHLAKRWICAKPQVQWCPATPPHTNDNMNVWCQIYHSTTCTFLDVQQNVAASEPDLANGQHSSLGLQYSEHFGTWTTTIVKLWNQNHKYHHQHADRRKDQAPLQVSELLRLSSWRIQPTAQNCSSPNSQQSVLALVSLLTYC